MRIHHAKIVKGMLAPQQKDIFSSINHMECTIECDEKEWKLSLKLEKMIFIPMSFKLKSKNSIHIP